MFNKDIKVFKNYNIEKDMMDIYEYQMCVSLFLEKSSRFMRFFFEYCSEEQEEDYAVEELELRDFFTEYFYPVTNKNISFVLPNTFYFDALYTKKGKNVKLINKFIKTLKKVNKLNCKLLTKAGIDYNI